MRNGLRTTRRPADRNPRGSAQNERAQFGVGDSPTFILPDGRFVEHRATDASKIKPSHVRQVDAHLDVYNWGVTDAAILDHIARLPHARATFKQLVRELGTRGASRADLDAALDRLEQ